MYCRIKRSCGIGIGIGIGVGVGILIGNGIGIGNGYGIGESVAVPRSEIVSPTDDLLHRGSEQDGLQLKSVMVLSTRRLGGKLTCSNCAVCEPLISHSGGYASTIPLETRLFNCPGRSAICVRRPDDGHHGDHTYAEEIFVLPQAIKISTTKRQCSEILGDRVQQAPGR